MEIRSALEKGAVSDLNYILHFDGTPVWSQGETVCVTDDSGEIFLVKIVYDMDHQKLLEEFFIASEKKQSLLSGIFDTLPTGIEVFKSIRNEEGEIIDFEYTLINKAAEKLMRRPRKEFIGKRLLEEYQWDMSNDQITGTPALYRLFNFKQQSTTLSEFLAIVSRED
jgi:PAS domain-containing protein